MLSQLTSSQLMPSQLTSSQLMPSKLTSSHEPQCSNLYNELSCNKQTMSVQQDAGYKKLNKTNNEQCTAHVHSSNSDRSLCMRGTSRSTQLGGACAESFAAGKHYFAYVLLRTYIDGVPYYVLQQKRAGYDQQRRSYWQANIGFIGGAAEAIDKNPWDTVCRETYQETNIDISGAFISECHHYKYKKNYVYVYIVDFSLKMIPLRIEYNKEECAPFIEIDNNQYSIIDPAHKLCTADTIYKLFKYGEKMKNINMYWPIVPKKIIPFLSWLIQKDMTAGNLELTANNVKRIANEPAGAANNPMLAANNPMLAANNQALIIGIPSSACIGAAPSA